MQKRLGMSARLWIFSKYVFTFVLYIFCIFDIFCIFTGQRSYGPPCHWAVSMVCPWQSCCMDTAQARLLWTEIKHWNFYSDQTACFLSTMKKWIDYASWKPIPGGLTSDNEFLINIRKFGDSNDTWTPVMVFGKVGANNVGCSAEREARQVGCLVCHCLNWTVCLY